MEVAGAHKPESVIIIVLAIIVIIVSPKRAESGHSTGGGPIGREREHEAARER